MNSGQPRETNPRAAPLRARSIRPRDPKQSKAALSDKPESPYPKEDPINWTSILRVVAGIVTVASVIISLFWSASLVESTVEVAEKQITPAADQRVADIRSEAYAPVHVGSRHSAGSRCTTEDHLHRRDVPRTGRSDCQCENRHRANTTVPVQDHHHWVFGSIRRPQCVDKRSRRLGGCFRSV